MFHLTCRLPPNDSISIEDKFEVVIKATDINIFTEYLPSKGSYVKFKDIVYFVDSIKPLAGLDYLVTLKR